MISESEPATCLPYFFTGMSLQQACLEQYLRRVQLLQRSHSVIILHYDPAARDLRPWLWPVTQSGIRVNPTGLCKYRNDHQFRAPCCLCAYDAAAYVESAIYVSLGGLYHGEYVAGCANGRCGYLICLERMYTRSGLLLQTFPPRVAGAPCPPPVLYSPTHENKDDDNVVPRALPAARGFKRGSPSLLLAPMVPGSMFEQPARAPETTQKLLRLSRPDLSESEFRELFPECCCRLVMTSRVFKDHVCQVGAAAAVRARLDVIDLTLEDSDKSREGPSSESIIDWVLVDFDDSY